MSTDTVPMDATAEAASALPITPRTRWAAIVWGSFFTLLAAGALWLMTSGPDALSDWVSSLTIEAIVACVVLAIGVLVLITGAAGLLRRAQRRFNG